MVVLITSTGSVTDLRFAFPEPVDPGAWSRGQRDLSERAARQGARIGIARRSRTCSTEPGYRARARSRSCSQSADAFEHAAGRHDKQAVRRSGAAGLLEEMRSEEIRRLPQPDGGARKARCACSTCLAQRLDPRRTFARVGEELEQRGTARSCTRRKATYAGSPISTLRRGQSPRAASDGLREGAACTVRSAALTELSPLRRRGLRRGLMSHRRSATTTSMLGDPSRRRRRHDQDGLPAACARAPSRRLRRSEADVRFRSAR